MNRLLFLLLCLISISAYTQTGINIKNPRATLHIEGRPNDATSSDGFIVPRLTGAQLRDKDAVYTADNHGQIVFVTEPDPAAQSDPPTAVKTKYVTHTGHFYYDAVQEVWFGYPRSNEVLEKGIVHGNAPDEGINALQWDTEYDTGGSIDLTSGQWWVEFGAYIGMGTVTNGNWTVYPANKVIQVDGSVWCSCSLSSTPNSYTAVNASTGLVDGSGRAAASGIARGERSAFAQGGVLINTTQPRTYYLFVICRNYGASLGSDRAGNIFGPAWERWFFATHF